MSFFGYCILFVVVCLLANNHAESSNEALINLSVDQSQNSGAIDETNIEISVYSNQEDDCDCEDCDCTESKFTEETASEVIRNCDDVYNSGAHTDGVYVIYTGKQFVQVECEFQIGGPHWMVFQRRINGEVDFNQDWDSYVNGFGNLRGEFWLGLQALHEITTSTPYSTYRLRVDLEDWNGENRYTEYSYFSVGNNGTYNLSVNGPSGSAGNGFLYHNNKFFSTKDQDNDGNRYHHCAVENQSGWWHRGNCYIYSNLNGKYRNSDYIDNSIGIIWGSWKGRYYSLKRVSMKIRPN